MVTTYGLMHYIHLFRIFHVLKHHLSQVGSGRTESRFELVLEFFFPFNFKKFKAKAEIKLAPCKQMKKICGMNARKIDIEEFVSSKLPTITTFFFYQL